MDTHLLSFYLAFLCEYRASSQNQPDKIFQELLQCHILVQIASVFIATGTTTDLCALREARETRQPLPVCVHVFACDIVRDCPIKARRCWGGLGKSLLSTDPPALRPQRGHGHLCRNPPVCARGWSPARWSKQSHVMISGPFVARTRAASPVPAYLCEGGETTLHHLAEGA